MKILITGGAGYVGSVMARIFMDAGHDITVLDDLSMGHKDAIPKGAAFIQGDVGNVADLIKVSDSFEAVVHLAAYLAAGESMTIPESYWDNNVRKSLTLLKVMRQLNINKLVFASSAAVYGNPTKTPITENDPKEPTNTYGMTKLAVDMAITSQSWAYGLSATSLRFFNVAGSYKDAGERHLPETHIIPILLDVASGKRSGFTLYGQDYDTPDGTCIRDYIHVVDLARAALLSLDKQKQGVHSIYNLGTGVGFSNFQVVESVKRVTNKDIPVVYEARRPGDPAVLVASSELAKEEIGWEPHFNSLDKIIGDAWQFYNVKPNV